MKTDFFKKIVQAFGFALGVYIILVILQPIIFANRFGVFSNIAGVDVSYHTKESAKAKIEKVFATYYNGKITIGDKIVTTSTLLTGIDTQKTVNEAMLVEQRGYFVFSKTEKKRHPLVLDYNEQGIRTLLMDAYDKFSITPIDADVKVNGQTSVSPEKNGQHLLFGESRQNILAGLADMAGNINYKIITQVPALTQEEAEEALSNAKIAVSESITLLSDGTSHVIKSDDLKSWLKITSTAPKTLVAIENFVPQKSAYSYLDPTKVYSFVDNLAKDIDKEAKNVRLGVVGGKVVAIEKEEVGRIVDRKDAINQIQEAVVGERIVTLKITTTQPEIKSDGLTELGLTELVSTGWTDFSGSPTNRTHNIVTGASKFNGVLIKPEEKFSFNTVLGPVDASTGYLPELVILANKTVPEFGGGLCQVSSTAFRAALNAGFPILERYAHAYPVTYYKPYGVDATIYLPSPDLRFTNNSGKYILIQTRIEGKRLYFDFYGTKSPGMIKFSGNDKGTGAVAVVENITPYIYDQGVRGKNSFTAVFYRHIYDVNGKLTSNDRFISKYDSPDKYPH